MSDYIPFEMQEEIVKKLPIKSILQFRSVSKQWKCLIDSSEFINNYHNNENHLFLCYSFDSVQTYTSIVDNDTFPQHKFSLTAPGPVNLLRRAFVIGSSLGIICLYGIHRNLKTRMVVLWNPAVRKSVGILVPGTSSGNRFVGFGVCPDTSVPKLVRIDVVYNNSTSVRWEVDVFTLGSRVWKTVFDGPPFKTCHLQLGLVCIEGVIYVRAFDDVRLDRRMRSNLIISFDLKTEKFGEVCLPDSLVHADGLLKLSKVNDSLGVLEYCYVEGGISVCGVWMMTDGVTFTKIFTVKALGRDVYNGVLGFRKNGEVIIENVDDDDDDDDEDYDYDHDHHEEKSGLEVYDPLSGHINYIGVNGDEGFFDVESYIETLLLLDQSNSIIH